MYVNIILDNVPPRRPYVKGMKLLLTMNLIFVQVSFYSTKFTIFIYGHIEVQNGNDNDLIEIFQMYCKI